MRCIMKIAIQVNWSNNLQILQSNNPIILCCRCFTAWTLCDPSLLFISLIVVFVENSNLGEIPCDEVIRNQYSIIVVFWHMQSVASNVIQVSAPFVLISKQGLTGKVGSRVINTSLCTPEKDGTSFGSGKRKLRASSSKLASIIPAANGIGSETENQMWSLINCI